MPSVNKEGKFSPAQAHLMAADYGRAKRGEPTRTGMSEEKLREWVHADVALENRKKALKEQVNGGRDGAS